ncbi:LemA family protein [Vulgatibacter sp.]|uniref:LemA family protein n=1 Tax=Vulgatibacter sp. TaxID=1971226 RepID=UPI003561FCE6
MIRTRLQTLLALSLALLATGCGVQSIPQAENAVDAAWAEVQNQYQRRADLVPNLVNTVKGFAQQEREVLEAVTSARARATGVTLQADQLTPENLRQFEQAQAQLSGALGRLLAVSERYPDLRSNENFRDLQAQLEGTENRISIARRRYIEAVQGFNNLITVPPTSFTNSLFYQKDPKPQFTATTPDAERPPEVKF